MLTWRQGKPLAILLLVGALTACGQADSPAPDPAEHTTSTTGNSSSAHEETATHNEQHTQSEDSVDHVADNQHGHGSGQLSEDLPITPFDLSKVQGVVASTSLTALLAEAAGATNVTYIAPVELRHPPEHDYRPSDISKATDSYLVYLGYEPFMSKLIEAGEIPQERVATIEVDNTPKSYHKATQKLADIWGTQHEQAKFLHELEAAAAEIEQAAEAKQVSGQRVIAQVYMIPILEWLGYDIVGEFGPDELTPSRLAELAHLKPDLIVDNLHMPQGAGFAEVSKDTQRVELRSYPEQEMDSVIDILRYNARMLGILE